MRQIAILLAIVVYTCLATRQQSVGVTGRLMCGNKPAAGVKVKLWDEDTGKIVITKLENPSKSTMHEDFSIAGPDPDDLLAEAFTDAKGEFNIKVGVSTETMDIIWFTNKKAPCPQSIRFKGSERETTNIDPVFKVYHDCDDGIKPGQRKVTFRIPSQYIYPGGLPKRIFNIGVLNLETIFPKEERDLI
ncbi:hypothetical protein Y032_0581g272 [Ancylostoma ceylanicum]|nr:hypothetical protein Y032_0581g272 [Ancylostoma ceylanicum]